ncbi:reverse transcriptase family protein [Ralstonia solanacearum]|uniref:reverse transcriptase family protein n=1 Tax=Ralstonia solanacearum TaxID=305 RepID=UPI002305C3B5|nr:reverse transcriptase family protein [Ralstonia solanacearum]MDB0510591.1 reverse transcriptase family protein [Ralstonia solanacearum]MDB0515096.1 reverse transcriptase family protein [Ralstonia solanacearum]
MWSSQRYLSEGKKSGAAQLVIDNAISQIELVLDQNNNIPAILSLKHFSLRSRVGYKFLRSVVERKEENDKQGVQVYRYFNIRKKSGGTRTISIPHPQLLIAQKWLATNVLSKLSASNYSFAFSPGSNIVECAKKHIEANWLVKMDVKDFFGSISEIDVYRQFRKLKYQPLVAFELSRIVTWPKSPRVDLPRWELDSVRSSIGSYIHTEIGCLPQGAPTSPMLSNLVANALDEELSRVANKFGVRYTRYCDDLTFSTRRKSFDRNQAKALIEAATMTMLPLGFSPNEKKTVVIPPGARKQVLGLNVDGPVPTLSKEFKSKIRQHLFFLKKNGPAAHAADREFDTIWGLKRRLYGLADYAFMVEPEYGKHVKSALSSINWPV